MMYNLSSPIMSIFLLLLSLSLDELGSLLCRKWLRRVIGEGREQKIPIGGSKCNYALIPRRKVANANSLGFVVIGIDDRAAATDSGQKLGNSSGQRERRSLRWSRRFSPTGANHSQTPGGVIRLCNWSWEWRAIVATTFPLRMMNTTLWRHFSFLAFPTKNFPKRIGKLSK